jgi:cytochrome P450
MPTPTSTSAESRSAPATWCCSTPGPPTATVKVFTHPERFDITRTDNPHLTFGHGAHFCPGAPLARIELQALFKMLPARFPTLRPAVPVEELRTKTNLIFGGLTELPVTW